MSVKIIPVLSVSLFMLATVPVCAADGIYDAKVYTDVSSYHVPVEVRNGEVTEIHWPNGEEDAVSGADLSGREAEGHTVSGGHVEIEIEDSSYAD